MPSDKYWPFQMTPDERDRLVRLEEQVKNAASDTHEIRRLIERMVETRAARDIVVDDRLAAQDRAIGRIESAVKQAASFTAGGWWVFTKIVAVILAFLGAGAWVVDHWPFKH